MVARVDNDLLRLGWRCGEEIVIRRENVLEVAEAEDKTVFFGLVSALGSEAEAAMVWSGLREAACPRRQRTRPANDASA